MPEWFGLREPTSRLNSNLPDLDHTSGGSVKNTVSTKSSTFAGFIGNFLEQYDKTLYGLVAPLLASLFFSDLPLLTGLIATFAIACVGVVSYPFGALFFGRIGDRKGREIALFITMTGMAVVTICIGCLPTSQQAGGYAWLFLAVLHSLQDFFIAGESIGAAIFLLEKTKENERGWMSSLYGTSTMLGILTASGLVTFFSVYGLLENNWRWLFWLGGLPAVTGIILRASAKRNAVSPLQSSSKKSVASLLFAQRKHLFAIMLASGFSYTTYTFPFTFMTNFAPLISEFSASTMLKLNTLLLTGDLLLLPLFGLLSKRISGFKMMKWAAFGAALLAFPLFALLQNPTETNILLVRIVIVVLGVIFASPFYMWTLSVVPQEHRYTIISFGYALGSRLIGVPGIAIAFWLYQATEMVIAPASYLCATGLLAAFTIWKTTLKTVPVQQQTA